MRSLSVQGKPSECLGSTHQEVLLDREVLSWEGPLVHNDVAFLEQALLRKDGQVQDWRVLSAGRWVSQCSGCIRRGTLLLRVLGRPVVLVPGLVFPRRVESAVLCAFLECLKIGGCLRAQPRREQMVLPRVCGGEEER